MQYCMATPRHFLQSTKYDNLTTIRVSEDVFTRDKWDQFFYSSRLASALGVYPFTDVFGSNEKVSTLIATLSAGIVGVGDRLGEVNAENLLYAVRPDGIIVKPDVPAVPTDESILNDAHNAGEPLVSYTYTDHGPMRALYVFAHPRTEDRTLTFTPAALGLSGNVYIYNWLADRGRRIRGDEPWTQTDQRRSGVPRRRSRRQVRHRLPRRRRQVRPARKKTRERALRRRRPQCHSRIRAGGTLDHRAGLGAVDAARHRHRRPRRQDRISTRRTGRFHVEVFPAKSGTARISASLPTHDDDAILGRD